MAKHAVPKKKSATPRSKKRYAAYVLKRHVKLGSYTNICKCPSCGEAMLNSLPCRNCGKYRGRQVLNMGRKIEKITKVKA